jgi:PKD repeat protein
MTRTITAAVLATIVAGMAAAGCTINKQDAPAASGPSEMSMAITMYASPDILRQDGVSQSQVTVQAQDSKGQALKNLPLRLDIWVGNSIVDFGQLSGKNLTTGSDGRATALYTAPPAPTQAVDSLTIVRIVATPIGSDYGNSTERAVSIRLVPLGVVLPPNGAPMASFVYSPSAPLTQAPITFDGSSSFDLDGSIVSHVWNFGDGSTGTGSLVQHQYNTGGTYSVSLTVTDDRGLTNSKVQSIAVSNAANPTALFDFSPTAPQVNQQVFFNAAKSTAVTGRTIARYDWDFGNGRQDSGQLASEVFTKAGTFVVLLTVTDDVGKKGTTSQSVTVGGTDLPVTFTFSPTSPTVGQTVFFNGTGSNITSYAWDFGDGSTGVGATPSHTYATAATYVVRLTVTDNDAKTATTTKNVTVTSSGSATPTAAFTFSPTSPGVGQNVFFNGSGSSSGAGIASYAWDFGDGSTGVGATPSHTFATAATYVVRLTVTDNNAKTATTTNNVTVSTGSTPTLIAIFTVSPSPARVRQQVTVDASQSTGSIVSYEWNFGDSTTIYTTAFRTFTHAYEVVGEYTITLTVVDTSGRRASKAVGISIVAVGPLPVANFTFSPSPATVGSPVLFDAGLSTGAIVRYEWVFGDSLTVYGYLTATTTHPYAAAGSYSVTLTVTDSSGNQSTLSRVVIVQ